jgi:hypothetical protein
MNAMPFMNSSYVPGGLRSTPVMPMNPDAFIKRLEDEIKALEEQEKKEKEEKERAKQEEKRIEAIIDTPAEPVIIDSDIDEIRNEPKEEEEKPVKDSVVQTLEPIDVHETQEEVKKPVVVQTTQEIEEEPSEQTEEDIERQIAELLDRKNTVKSQETEEINNVLETPVDEDADSDESPTEYVIKPADEYIKPEIKEVNKSEDDIEEDTNKKEEDHYNSDNEFVYAEEPDSDTTYVEESKQTDKVEPTNKPIEPDYYHESVTTKPTYEELEKPKINIDVDSVVVDNHDNKNDDFFDDFFGSEDE